MATPNAITTGRGADIDSWKHRLDGGCARFYAPLSVVTFALTFFAYYASEPDSSVRYGNLWQEVARTGHSFDVAAVLVFLAVIVLLAVAALEKLGPAGLIACATGAVVIGSMLLTTPGFQRKPSLTEAGILDVALSFFSAAVLLGHGLTLIILDLGERRRRGRPSGSAHAKSA